METLVYRIFYLLEATHVSYKIVNEESVYSCTGSPRPHEIKTILDWLLTNDFDHVYRGKDLPYRISTATLHLILKRIKKI